MLSRFDPLVEAAAPSKNDGPSFFPEELLLLIPVMRIRAKQGGVVEAVVIDIVDKISDAFSGNGSKSQPAAVNEPNTYVRLSEKAFDDEIEKLVTRLPELRDLETVIANVGVSEKGNPQRVVLLVLTFLLLSSRFASSCRDARRFAEGSIAPAGPFGRVDMERSPGLVCASAVSSDFEYASPRWSCMEQCCNCRHEYCRIILDSASWVAFSWSFRCRVSLQSFERASTKEAVREPSCAFKRAATED